MTMMDGFASCSGDELFDHTAVLHACIPEHGCCISH